MNTKTTATGRKPSQTKVYVDDLIPVYGKNGEYYNFCSDCSEKYDCKYKLDSSKCIMRKLYLEDVEMNKGKKPESNIKSRVGQKFSHIDWSNYDKKIIEMFMNGSTYHQIAIAIGVNKNTLESHIYKLRREGKLENVRKGDQ